MITVTIEKVKNGFIKTSVDTNIHGLGNQGSEVVVFESIKRPNESIELLWSIARDLGLNMHNLEITFNEQPKIQSIKTLPKKIIRKKIKAD